MFTELLDLGYELSHLVLIVSPYPLIENNIINHSIHRSFSYAIFEG